MLLRMFALFATLAVMTATVQAAEEPAKGQATAKPEERAPAVIQEEARLKQETLARRFREFEQKMISLAQRLEDSAKPEEREKTQILKDAVKLANESGVDIRFHMLIHLLQKSKASNLKEVNEAIDQQSELIARIEAVLDRMGKSKELNDLIVTLTNIKKEQRDVGGMLDNLKKRMEDELLKGLLDPKNS